MTVQLANGLKMFDYMSQYDFYDNTVFTYMEANELNEMRLPCCFIIPNKNIAEGYVTKSL